MPKEKEVTNHPCHLLSLPSAKRFWCRHCMTVFEDAITRWRHSRSCRYGAVNNFMRRRELEAKALQNTTVLNPVEARLEQSIQMCDLASTSAPGETDLNSHSQILSGTESYNCFICHQTFASMDEMKVHVKYPCGSSKIITSRVPHPKHSVPVFIEALPRRTHQWQTSSQHSTHQATTFPQAHNPQQSTTQTSFDIEIQPHQEMESQYDSTSVSFEHNRNSTSDGITPTNIYVNEQGETVIEVENLDLNSEGGELSLAHLLAQLSQQGIVFDKTRTAELQTAHQVTVSGASVRTLYATNENCHNSTVTSKIDEEEMLPTAEDAANTLAQLAGLRSFTRTGEIKPMGEVPEHSQGCTGQNYSYSSSTPESNKPYTVNTQPQIEIKYDYDYCSTSSARGHPIGTSQHSIVSASQEYDHDKVDQEAVEDTLHFYTDSSNVTYITDTDNHHQIHMKAETISSSEYSRYEDVGNQSILLHRYPVQVDGSGRFINVTTDLSAKQTGESQGDLPREELKAVDSDINLPTTEEHHTLISSFGTNIPSQNRKTPILAHAVESKSDARYIKVNADVDEFTIQTVSLQEIVDSETDTLSFVGQTNSSQNDSFLTHVPNRCPVSSESVSTTVTASSDRQATLHNGSSHVTTDGISETQGTAPYPAALYIVTSSGILPISNKNAYK